MALLHINLTISMENTTVSSKMSPKFFFLSLGHVITLIASASSFLMLAFEVLTRKFPDALNAVYQYGYQSYNFDTARGAIATLIIMFPLYLIISHYWNKQVPENMGHVDVGIRKWMIYLILFLAGLMSAIDLVTLVRYFVSGEITTRFILKVCAVLLVALFAGWYYMLLLKDKKTFWGFQVQLWSAIKASAWVLALIIWSFTIIGTPSEQRAWRFDERRIQDLQTIQSQVITYWQQKEKLPATLTDLSNPTSYTSVPVEPEFEKGLKYEYKATGDLSFELCATFSKDMPKGWVEGGGYGGIMPMATTDVAVSYPYPGPDGTNDSWDHKVGRTCYERTIDKDIYPPYPKPMKSSL
jgi:hypothetical protein